MLGARLGDVARSLPAASSLLLLPPADPRGEIIRSDPDKSDDDGSTRIDPR